LSLSTAGTHEALSVGNIRSDEPMRILADLRQSPMIRTIKENGLDAVVCHLASHDRQAVLRATYSSSCHLCHKVVSVVGGKLDNRLSADPARVALLLATPVRQGIKG